MCGLVGMIGDIGGLRMKEIMKSLLVIDTLRGDHSAGIAAVLRHQSDWSLSKQVGSGNNLVASESYKDLMSGNNKAFIGHNRMATKGVINASNAHPFEFSNVVGAHNGTITAPYRMTDWKDFTVDSEAIFWGIEKEGAEVTIPKLEGGYALTWYDLRNDQLHMIRNSSRPLYYAWTEDKSCVVWASEAIMIEFCLIRAGVKRGSDILEVPADTLLSFDLPRSITEKIKEPSAKKLKGYSVVAAVGGNLWGNSRNNYQQNHTNRNANNTKKITTTITTKVSLKRVTKKDIKAFSSKSHSHCNCCYCNSDILKGDKALIIPIGGTEDILCSHCAEEDNVVAALSAHGTTLLKNSERHKTA